MKKKNKRAVRRSVKNACSKACADHNDENDRLRRLAQELEVHQVELNVQNDELRESRGEAEKNLLQLAEIFVRAPIGYLILNQEGSICKDNEAARATFGARHVALGNKELRRQIVPRDQAIFDTFLRASWQGEQTSDACEVSAFKSCGSVIEIKLSGVVLPKAEIPSLLIAVEDVTRRRIWERRLRQSEHALLKAQGKTRSFLAMLSHELRNPLASIRTSIEVLEQARNKPEVERRCRDVIGRQALHLVRLVDDLLDVTRITHGKIKLNIGRLNMSSIVREAVEAYREPFSKSDLRLECDLPQDALWVDADPTRLVQVISNVLCNSRKFTPRGGAVDIVLRVVENTAVLSIKDTGIGIAAEALSDICEPFYQVAQDLDRSAGGLGLGLGMVKSLVKMQGGDVVVRSDGRGKGTEVVMTLALCAPAPESVNETTPKERESLRVVVIDDNSDSAESLKELLTLHGHKVSTAKDGAQGLIVMRQADADAVLCDIGLPRMDGYSVAREVRSDITLKNTYMIALTGYAQSRDRSRAMDAGFDHFIAKPCGARDVLKAIRERPSERH